MKTQNQKAKFSFIKQTWYIVSTTNYNPCKLIKSNIGVLAILFFLSLRFESKAQTSASFTLSDTAYCAPKCIKVVSTTVNAKSYSWDFGDPGSVSVDTTQQSEHCYMSPGSYTISLSVKTTAGFMISQSHIINIYPVPEAQFTFGQISGNTYQFTSTSSGLSNGGKSGLVWYFGDTDTASANSVTHTYSSSPPDSVLAYLIVQNSWGCLDTAFIIINHLNPNDVKESAEEKGISLFPNPSIDGFFHLSFQNGNVADTELEIKNISGKLIFASRCIGTFQSINLSEEPDGLYLIHIYNNHYSCMRELILKR
jgi:PKD repeat protein